ncbi:MAG: TolC family protein [Dictyoglomaceae bacterium]
MYKRILTFFLILFIINCSFGENFLTFNSLFPFIQRSPLWQIYQAQFENSVQSYNLAQISFKPQLSIQGGYGFTKDGKEVNTGSLSLNYSQVIFSFGKAGIQQESSSIDLEQAKNNLRSNYLNLYYQFTQYFYNLYLAQERLKILEDSYKLAVRQREIAEKQFNNKTITETNLLDYKQREKLSEINLNSAKNNLEIAYKVLENFLGIKLERIPVKLDIYFEPFNEKPEDLLNILYNENLTIKNAKLSLEKSKLSIKEANLPSWIFSLNGSYSSGNSSYNISFDTQNYALNVGFKQNFGETQITSSDVWKVSFSFSIPILDGGSKNISLKKAELSLKQAEINFENTKKEVELNFWKIYYNLLQAQENVKQKQFNLEQKKINYDIQKIKYELGLITEIELKASEIDYLQAEYDLKDAILNFNLQKIQLNIILNR